MFENVSRHGLNEGFQRLADGVESGLRCVRVPSDDFVKNFSSFVASFDKYVIRFTAINRFTAISDRLVSAFILIALLHIFVNAAVKIYITNK